MTTEEHCKVTGVDDDKQPVLPRQLFSMVTPGIDITDHQNPIIEIGFTHSDTMFSFMTNLFHSTIRATCAGPLVPVSVTRLSIHLSGANGLVWCRWRSINFCNVELAILPLWATRNTAIPVPKCDWFPLSVHPKLCGQTTVIWSFTRILKARQLPVNTWYGDYGGIGITDSFYQTW